jgi:hypothetical protein
MLEDKTVFDIDAVNARLLLKAERDRLSDAKISLIKIKLKTLIRELEVAYMQAQMDDRSAATKSNYTFWLQDNVATITANLRKALSN